MWFLQHSIALQSPKIRAAKNPAGKRPSSASTNTGCGRYSRSHSFPGKSLHCGTEHPGILGRSPVGAVVRSDPPEPPKSAPAAESVGTIRFASAAGAACRWRQETPGRNQRRSIEVTEFRSSNRHQLDVKIVEHVLSPHRDLIAGTLKT